MPIKIRYTTGLKHSLTVLAPRSDAIAALNADAESTGGTNDTVGSGVEDGVADRVGTSSAVIVNSGVALWLFEGVGKSVAESLIRTVFVGVNLPVSVAKSVTVLEPSDLVVVFVGVDVFVHVRLSVKLTVDEIVRLTLCNECVTLRVAVDEYVDDGVGLLRDLVIVNSTVYVIDT